MDTDERIRRGHNASVVSIACNVALVLAKGVVGMLIGSIAMVADATNNLMDAAANVVTLVGFKLARKPADTGHPFGHGRMEYLAGLGVSVLVLLAGIELVKGSIERILNPSPVSFTSAALILLALSVCVKLWMAHYNHKVAKAIDSNALEAASKDARYDAIATGAILLGAVISNNTGLVLDGPLGLAVGLFVTWGGIDLLRDTINPLLGRTPDPELVERVRQRILSYPGVLDAHDLMVHDYGPGHQFASAHVEMPAEEDPLKTHEIIDSIERDLRATEGIAIILHYDPIVTHKDEHPDLRGRVSEAVRAIDPILSIHDPHLDITEEGTELSFDCVRPATYELDDSELEQRITHEMQSVIPNVICHITFDEGFVSPMSEEGHEKGPMSPAS